MVAFNGDRVTFAKTYVKKSKSKKIDPAQTSILEQAESVEKKGKTNISDI